MNVRINKNCLLVQLLFFIFQIIYSQNGFANKNEVLEKTILKITTSEIGSTNLVFKNPGSQALTIENHLPLDNINIGHIYFIGDEVATSSIANNISIHGSTGCSNIKAGSRCTMIITASENFQASDNTIPNQLLLNYTIGEEKQNKFAILRLKADYNQFNNEPKESTTKLTSAVLGGISTYGAIYAVYNKKTEALIKPIFTAIITNKNAADSATNTAIGLLGGLSYTLDEKIHSSLDNEYDGNKFINKMTQSLTMHLLLNLQRCYDIGAAAAKVFEHSEFTAVAGSRPLNSIFAVGVGIFSGGSCLALAVTTGLAGSFSPELIKNAFSINIIPEDINLPATNDLLTSAFVRTGLRGELVTNDGAIGIWQDTLSGISMDAINAIYKYIMSMIYDNDFSLQQPTIILDSGCNHAECICTTHV